MIRLFLPKIFPLFYSALILTSPPFLRTSVLCASYIGPGVIIQPILGLLLVLGLDCVQCSWHIILYIRIHRPCIHIPISPYTCSWHLAESSGPEIG